MKWGDHKSLLSDIYSVADEGHTIHQQRMIKSMSMDAVMTIMAIGLYWVFDQGGSLDTTYQMADALLPVPDMGRLFIITLTVSMFVLLAVPMHKIFKEHSALVPNEVLQKVQPLFKSKDAAGHLADRLKQKGEAHYWDLLESMRLEALFRLGTVSA